MKASSEIVRQFAQHGTNRNDGPMHKFKGKEQIKLVLDMSNDGPTFKMLENLMAATAGGKSGKGGGEHVKAVLSKP